MKYTLAYIDKQLCVCSAWPLESEPIMRKLYWPVSRVQRGGNGLAPDVQKIFDSGAELSHRFSEDPFSYYKDGGTIAFYLRDNGRTEAIKIENLPIDPPPARGKPIRWYQGRWQRELKRGWVDC